jgi:hypothetical protein
MKKMVLLPYDRYQSLLNVTPQSESTKTSEQDQTPNAGDICNVIERPTERLLAEDGAMTARETLIQRFPKSMRSRVRSVLDHIGPYVTWNEKGEVSIQGQHIPGSNIIDLLKVHLKDYKDFSPIGKDAFRTVLTEHNVPMSLLSPSARQQTGGRVELPPPPGIPVKRPEISTPVEEPEAKKIKWLRL